MSPSYLLSKPTLCMIVGAPGSGKTLVAKEIARQLIDAAYIDKDMIQDKFSTTERINRNIYEKITGPTFHFLVDFADAQLSLGKTPIIDAPYSRNHNLKNEYRDWVSHYKRVADKHNVRLVIVRCLPPSTEELKKRIRERVDSGAHLWDQEHKLDRWEQWLKEEPADFPIPHNDVLKVVTDKPAGIIASIILEKYLKAEKIFE
ncbi:ATP-binding protein [Candidatus Woesearchaeota archaeon]|nr:ATP-binding protein [Candidatus Woesearchaeota archaeon]